MEIFKGSPTESQDSKVQSSYVKNSILVVEDNKLCRQLLVDVLSESYTLIEAENGQQAIRKVIESPPSLIITDIHMPVMNGLELLKELASNKDTKHIPVILVSSATEKEKTKQGLALGAIDYITKPFDITTLSQKVSNIINLIVLQKQIFTPASVIDEFSQEHLSPDQIFVKKLQDTLNKNYASREFCVSNIASVMAVSERQLQRKCNEVYGNGPSHLLRMFRLNKAKTFLLKGFSVTRTSELAGFDSPSYFSRCFTKAFNIQPKFYAQLEHKT
jgi:CheY-like chemotaxis protein